MKRIKRLESNDKNRAADVPASQAGRVERRVSDERSAPPAPGDLSSRAEKAAAFASEETGSSRDSRAEVQTRPSYDERPRRRGGRG